MYRNLITFVLVLALGIAFCVAPASAVNVQYTGGTDPVGQGWYHHGGSLGYADGDYWNFDSGGRYEIALTAQDEIDMAAGWMATWVQKIDTTTGRGGDAYLRVLVGGIAWEIGVAHEAGNSQLWYLRDPDAGYSRLAYVPDVGYIDHTYQMVYDPAGDGGNGSVEVFLDSTSYGTLTTSMAFNWATDPVLQFGGWSTNDYSLKSISVVPEPATIALLGLGVLVLIRKRS